jgi:hypothetical protein
MELYSHNNNVSELLIEIEFDLCFSTEVLPHFLSFNRCKSIRIVFVLKQLPTYWTGDK